MTELSRLQWIQAIIIFDYYGGVALEKIWKFWRMPDEMMMCSINEMRLLVTRWKTEKKTWLKKIYFAVFVMWLNHRARERGRLMYSRWYDSIKFWISVSSITSGRIPNLTVASLVSDITFLQIFLSLSVWKVPLYTVPKWNH